MTSALDMPEIMSYIYSKSWKLQFSASSSIIIIEDYYLQTFLHSLTSASIGKASIVGPEAVGAIPYTGQIRFKMTQSLIREYFLYFANSDTYLNQIDRMKTGNCIQHYGPTHLKEVYIPIPPIEEQERIIKQLSSLLSSLYEIEESITM